MAKAITGFLFEGFPDNPAMRDQMEVGTAFAARHVSEGYPRHYSPAFAFSILLYPHRQQLTLRFACPKGSDTGLPSSDCVTRVY